MLLLSCYKFEKMISFETKKNLLKTRGLKQTAGNYIWQNAVKHMLVVLHHL